MNHNCYECGGHTPENGIEINGRWMCNDCIHKHASTVDERIRRAMARRILQFSRDMEFSKRTYKEHHG